MQEELISLKIARLAKKKGFDIPVLYYAFLFKDLQNKVKWIIVDSFPNQFGEAKLDDYNSFSFFIKHLSLPSQSLLQKWLRDKHKLNVHLFSVHGLNRTKWGVNVYDLTKGFSGEDYLKYSSIKSPGELFSTYEEALEKGLYQALKLIKC